ncbi:MAG: carboxypeptidase regulatory-like domain-containing protein, partial [Bacteroidia bacterium]|nr:carboxypeptidase regulatory-like domain-containing protein [Bacteroidia bacterium]
GTYYVTVSDSLNCTDTDSVIITAPDALVANITETNVNCSGENNGAVDLTVTGGILPYTYLWSETSTTEDLLNLIAGVYCVTVSDSNLCATNICVTITEPAAMIATISQSNAGCDSLCNGAATIVVTGGITPYSYNWSDGQTTMTSVGLCAGDYYISVADSNSCLLLDSVTIESSMLASINGVVQYSGGALNENAAIMELYKETMIPGSDYELVATMSNGQNGAFSFNGVEPGNYLVKAVLVDTSNYPYLLNSYYDSVYAWDSAIVISAVCDTIVDIVLNMYEITPPLLGSGYISGNINVATDGKATGDPVPGAEIYIEQEPSEEPVANIESDSTGFYEFGNLPQGDYSLCVDITGYTQFETYQFSITSEDTLFTGLNFVVDTSNSDSAGIYTDYTLAVWKKPAKDMNINIYPNPAKDKIIVTINLTDFQNLSGLKVSIYNIQGKNLTGFRNLSGLKNEISISALPSGVYYLRVQTNEWVAVRKLVKM